MDFMQIIFYWLKSIIERMKSISSFIFGDFLTGKVDEGDDFGFSIFDSPNKYLK